MGYTTDFQGRFDVTPPLRQEHADYLRAFNETRRMRRDPAIAEKLPDARRTAVGLPVGDEGRYFVGGLGLYGQVDDASVLDHNDEPRGQPGLWCGWRPSADGRSVEWDGAEKFYYYVEWLQYLIDHFLRPWGYTLNGAVGWDGEAPGDQGTIFVSDNAIADVRR
jgi:hypothetical protein